LRFFIAIVAVLITVAFFIELEHARGHSRESAIQVAAAKGDLATVRGILEHHDDKDLMVLCIIAAASEDQPQVLDWALSRDSSAVLIESALEYSVMGGHIECVEIALDHGVAPDAPLRGWGDRPMSWAAREGDLPLIRLLLKAGADVNITGDTGETALHAAVEAGEFEAARLLLSKGARAKCADRRGETPLMIAAASGQTALVNTLLRHGAPVSAWNAKGETAISQARAGKHDEIARILLANR
jgi:uncharacterized protein